jgi:hypothetical protein
MMVPSPHRCAPYSSFFLSLLWINARNNVAAQTAPRCDQFVQLDDFAENLQFRSIVEVTDATTGQGRLTVEATYTGLGWIGIGWSADGMMVPGVAVMGTDCNIAKWNMVAYAQDLSGVKQFDETGQTLTDTSFIQNDTHSILRFTKPLIEDGELPLVANGEGNIFLYAYGLDNELGMHKKYGARYVPLTACEGGTVPAAPVSDEVCTEGTSAPATSVTVTSAPIFLGTSFPVSSITETSAPVAVTETSAPVAVTSAPVAVTETSAPVAVTSAPIAVTETSAPIAVITSAPVSSSTETSAPIAVITSALVTAFFLFVSS